MKTFEPASRGLLLLMACLALTGCSAQWKFVFVNVTSEPLQVQYSGYKAVVIPPGESYKEMKQFYPPARFIFSKQPPPPKSTSTVTVATTAGTRLYSADGDDLFGSVWGSAEFPYVYVRVTRTEIKAFPTLAAARR